MTGLILAPLIFIAILTSPQRAPLRRVRSFLLISGISVCFYLALPILGLAFFALGGACELIKEATITKGALAYFPAKGKANWTKTLSCFLVVLAAVLIYSFDTTSAAREVFEMGLSEQSLILYLLLFFGAASIIKEGGPWK